MTGDAFADQVHQAPDLRVQILVVDRNVLGSRPGVVTKPAALASGAAPMEGRWIDQVERHDLPPETHGEETAARAALDHGKMRSFEIGPQDAFGRTPWIGQDAEVVDDQRWPRLANRTDADDGA